MKLGRKPMKFRKWGKTRDKVYRQEPLEFCEQIPMPTSEEPLILSKHATPFQNRFLQAVFDPIVRFCTWFGCRGSAKTFLAGAVVPLYNLHYSKNWLGLVISADKEGGMEHTRILRQVLQENPRLAEGVEVYKNFLVHKGNGCELRITSSDVSSSFPFSPDYIHMDEADKQEQQELFGALVTSVTKRKGSKLVITGNALLGGGWKADLLNGFAKKAAEGVKGFFSMRTAGNSCPWLANDGLLAELKELLPAAFQRFYDNIDGAEGSGDLFTAADIADCVYEDMLEDTKRTPGWIYHMGADIGIKKDSTAIAVVGTRPGRPLMHKVVALGIWSAQRKGKVSLDEVEEWTTNRLDIFRPRSLSYDPWNAAQLAEHLEGKCKLKEFHNKGDAATELTMTLQRVVTEARLEIPKDCGRSRDPRAKEFWDLQSDLGTLNVKMGADGAMRLDARRIGSRHGDASFAVALALREADKAAKLAPRVQMFGGAPGFSRLIQPQRAASVHGGRSSWLRDPRL